MPLLPELPGATPTVIPIRPPGYVDPTAMSGGLYFGMLLFFGIIILLLVLFLIVIKIWGKPIDVAAKARLSGDTIIQHFENSKIGILKLAPNRGGALRHKKVSDGTLITIPKGINTLGGQSVVNSWHLGGISVPTFIFGATTKLMKIEDATLFPNGIKTRDELQKVVTKEPRIGDINLIPESYDFNNFKDIIKKSNEPSLIPINIEYVTNFIAPLNQHYTESIITKKIYMFIMRVKDTFGRDLIIAAIAVFIVAIAMYFLGGSK